MSNMKLSRSRKHKFFTFRFLDEQLTEISGVIVRRNGNDIYIKNNMNDLPARPYPLNKMIYPTSLRFYNDNIISKYVVK